MKLRSILLKFILFIVILTALVYYSHGKENEYCDAESCGDTSANEIHVMITFYNAKANTKLIRTFTTTVHSLLYYSSVPLAIHIIGDDSSQKLAAEIISEKNERNRTYRVSI